VGQGRWDGGIGAAAPETEFGTGAWCEGAEEYLAPGIFLCNHPVYVIAADKGVKPQVREGLFGGFETQVRSGMGKAGVRAVYVPHLRVEMWGTREADSLREWQEKGNDKKGVAKKGMAEGWRGDGWESWRMKGRGR